MGCHGAIASGAIAAHPANITTRRVSGTRSGGRAAASASPPGSLAVGAEKYADVARRADAARFPRAAPVAAERSESVGTMRTMKGGLAAAIAAAALALNPALALAEDAPVASPLEQQAAPSPQAWHGPPGTTRNESPRSARQACKQLHGESTHVWYSLMPMLPSHPPPT